MKIPFTSDPSISDLINDRIDLENAMTELIKPFLKKYPRATHSIEFKAAHADHMAPVVRIRSTY
jgi:hypothetical protein